MVGSCSSLVDAPHLLDRDLKHNWAGMIKPQVFAKGIITATCVGNPAQMRLRARHTNRLVIVSLIRNIGYIYNPISC